MNSNLLFLTFFIIFIPLISIVYFYMYTKNRERYLLYHGISWIFYSLSIAFLLLGLIHNDAELISIRILFDMANILMLLFSTYSFAGIKAPTVWLRFALYISIWVILGVSFNFEIVSTYLPTVAYQVLLTVVTVIILVRYWNILRREKLILSILFILWGFGKACVSLLVINGTDLDIITLYVGEILYSNILNFALMIISIRRAQTRLVTAEQTFRTITENASDIFILVEPGGNPELKYISPSINTIFGISEETVYNDTHAFVTFVHPDDWKTFDFLFSRKNRLRERTAKVRAYDTDGKLHWCEVTVKKISDNRGSNLIEGIVRDITASQEAHDEMVKAKQSRDTLLSYVTHELKTPIASILGFSELLLENTSADENKKRDYLNIIHSKSITLTKLISDLVQLSKMETHQFSFEFSMMDCQSVTDTLWSRHRLDGQAAGLSLIKEAYDKDLERYYMILDIDRIDQVFTNILSNGMRYTESQKTIVVKFFIDSQKENYVFSITNFGKVIEDADMQHIFDRFYRVEKGQKSANEINSGLGLTLSKEIVESHQGSISVTSDRIEGTTFSIKIPLYEERTY